MTTQPKKLAGKASDKGNTSASVGLENTAPKEGSGRLSIIVPVIAAICVAVIVIGAIGLWPSSKPSAPVATTTAPAAVATAPSAPGAPVVGSVLPKDMVPGNWYATGNSQTVPHGTAFETAPRDCDRGGVKGKCAWKLRGS